jgi:hypothetical protein
MAISKTKTIADLRAAHDKTIINPRKVETTFAAMLKDGKEAHEYESEFMKRAGLANNEVGDVRKLFGKHVVVAVALNSKKAPRNVWFADAKVATKVCKDYPNAFRAWTSEDA